MKGTKVTYTPAEIVSAAKDGIVVSADGVYDYNLEKFQEQVNADILEEQENIQLRITHLTPEDVGALPFDTPYAESTSPGGPANSAEKLNTDAGSSKKPVYFENGIPVEVDHSVNKDVPADAVFTDTKNTAGATDSELKLFLIGATELTENPQTHSQDSAYIGTDGCIYSGNKKVITDVSDKADKVNTVTNVEYNNKKFTKTINENTSDIVDINKIKEDLELSKSDIELENVTNDALVKRSEMGVANGVATLGSDGKVPSSLLPGYVDDVIELLDMTTTAPQNCSKGDFYYNTISKKLFEATLNNQWDDGIVPPTGKIYTNLNNNKTYRWGGSEMVVISETVAIGTTTGTAFDGKEGYDHVTNNDIHVTTQNKENWNNKYLKPNEGIPKSDLSNEVKEALDNANSALQEETDPTVPAWAKEPTKPSYDLDEVPDGANRKIPTKVSELENDSHFTGNLGTVTKVKIGTQEHTPTNGIVELPAYPTTLPASDVPNWAKEPNKPSYTLDEIPDGDTRKLANKVDKITGKGLSTNDYTNEDKAKLGTIELGAQVHIAPTESEVKLALNVGEGTSKYLREDGTWVTPPNDNTTYEEATTQESGLMSSLDKLKLDNIESGALVHKAPTTLEVKNALGTGNGTTKYFREDGTWLVPPDTKYLSKVPEENGYDVSLVTTGDKYIWNHKLDNISDLSTIRSNATKGAEAKEDLTDYDAFVDLGLPSGTLWAKCNIGANKETEYGYYYQYGKGAALYAETLNQSNYTGTENPLSSEYDTAVQVLGGPWHMPTRVQMEELIANTTYQWTTINGINGGKFTATNGNYVFFPAAGLWYDGSQSLVGSNGRYWGSSPNGSNNAYSLSFYYGIKDMLKYLREGGCSVRPVCETPPSKLLRKIDKVFGKDLSTNDYTNAEKSKLGGIEAGALVHKAPTSTEVKNALGTGSGTDKFLREDGTWQTPNYTDISYSNKKLTKTVNGSSSDIVSTDTLKLDMNLNKVGNFKAVSTEANLGLTDTEKGNARSNIGAGTSSLVIGTTSNTAADGKIVDDHIKNTSNPHSVTKELVGLGNVKNLSITVTSTSVSDGTNTFNKYVHPSGTNPHGTTKSDVGLGNVTNDAQVKRTEMGSNNGVATLDNTGKVPSSQLPSFVDDVIEGYLYNEHFYKESAHTNLVTDEGGNSTDRLSGKIYVDLASNKTYRWGGSSYAIISDTLALGETSSTAYRGDRGKIAYDHSLSTHARTDANNSTISYDTTNKKITKTINGSLSDVVTASTIVTDGGGIKSHLSVTDNNPTLSWGIKSKVATIGSTDIHVTMPSNPNTTYKFTIGNTTNGDSINGVDLGTLKSEAAVSSGTTLSLVTTGEKATWNAKLNALTNPITGTGTSGCLVKFNGTTSITNGPTLSSSISTQSQSTKFLREDGTWATPSYTVNTWRGIQNNLTSSSNTTESLSAKQGYLLANGSARDNTKLPLAGGTMTGKLTIKTDNFNNLLHLNRTSSSGTWGPAISFDYDDICNGTLTMASNELYIGDNGSTKYKALHEGNSSVSLSGSTLTVKINGNSLSLTNTWRGILNNLTSTSTTDSLSAAQGKALNEKFANYLLKVTKMGSTTKPVYVSADGTFAECNSYPTSLPASDVYAWAKAATKPSYNLDEVTDGTSRKWGDKQDKLAKKGSATKPIYVSAAGTIAECNAYPTTLPASDVYDWAKASTKPSYNLDEVSDGSTRKLITAAAVCYTVSSAAKEAILTGYKLNPGNYTLITFVYDNVQSGALTLNINGTGAKPIWINGVASSSTNYTLPAGTYIIYYDGQAYYFDTNGDIPLKKYENLYLTFKALESGTFTFTNAINYSLDCGKTWVSLAANTNSPTITKGNTIMWKASLTPTSSTGIGKFNSTSKFIVEGNAMSLLYGDNFVGQTNLSEKDYTFRNLFLNCTGVTSAKNLSLPATTLANSCYSYMFYGCTSLIIAPELPATTLVTGCYMSMFRNCTSLTTAPELPATTLVEGCYTSMFRNCTSLTTASELPATTLADYCYRSMFNGCSNLTTAPLLFATTLTIGCYYGMFYGCKSLIIAPSLPATTLANYCYYLMFNGCTSLTTTPSLPATTLANNCYSYMFYGCTSLTTVPSLPATTLADYCYYYMFCGCTNLIKVPDILPATTLQNYCYSYMFYNCTNLTIAPELPAITLVNNCYNYMFYNCTNLTYIKALFTTAPGPSYTLYWTSGITSVGIFIKNPSVNWNNAFGDDRVPMSWGLGNAKLEYDLIRKESISSNLNNLMTRIEEGQSETVIYENSGTTTDYTITISSSYKTPDGVQLTLLCPKGGYCEVSYINIGGTIYVRGL